MTRFMLSAGMRTGQSETITNKHWHRGANLEASVGREEGCITYQLTQILTGHGCFLVSGGLHGEYLVIEGMTKRHNATTAQTTWTPPSIRWRTAPRERLNVKS